MNRRNLFWSHKPDNAMLTFFILLVCLSACNALAGPEQAARSSFDQFTQKQGLPYKGVTVQTLKDDGTFATVRITEWFRVNAQAAWTEQYVDVDVRDVGGQWSASDTMIFHDTLSTQQTKTAIAEGTATSVSATQLAEQATQAAVYATRAAAQATDQASYPQTQVAATATSYAGLTQSQHPYLDVIDKFVNAIRNKDCAMAWSLLSTAARSSLLDPEDLCSDWSTLQGYQLNYIIVSQSTSSVVVSVQAIFCCGIQTSTKIFMLDDSDGWIISEIRDAR